MDAKAKHIILPDGRKLYFLEFGDVNGHPVFYFHGSPSSYFEPLLIGNEIFTNYGLRIIAANRPGIGDSDFQTNRSFNNWPHDIVQLANHLGIEKFSIFGNSGGCAYVIACAAFISQRLISASVISGGWQMNMPETKRYLRFPFNLFWIVADKLPFLLPIFLSSMKSSPKESKEKKIAKARKMMPAPDFESIIKDERMEVMGKVIDESLINKKGVTWDLRLYLKKIDIDLKKIDFPITFYHGEMDRNMPIEVVRKMTSELPNAKLITCKGEAHLSVLCKWFEEAAKGMKQAGTV